MIEIPEIKELSVHLYDRCIGHLRQTQTGLCAFQYETDFLQEGFSISPIKLPLEQDVFVAEPLPFEGNFGVFDDSLPDGWGRLLQDRFLQNNGINPMELTILQRLYFVGKTGRGALEYEPSYTSSKNEGASEQELDGQALAALGAAAEGFYAQEIATEESLHNLFRYGGSSGGARPKAFVKLGGKEWLVKFRAATDAKDIGVLEYETSLLAKECGIEMPETRLFEGKYFASERFDRTASGKIHIVSAAGLLNANYRMPSLDYHALLTLCRVLTRNISQCEQLYRRMVFNVLIGNRDDHAKNFAFSMNSKGDWSLAPAYDLLPSTGFAGQHTTTVNGSGKPSKEDMLAISTAGGLSETQASKIIKEIEAKIIEIKK